MTCPPGRMETSLTEDSVGMPPGWQEVEEQTDQVQHAQMYTSMPSLILLMIERSHI